MVSPGRGNTSLNVVRSTLALPTIAIKACFAIVSPLLILRADYIGTRPGNRINSRTQRGQSCRLLPMGVFLQIVRLALDRFPCREYNQRQPQHSETVADSTFLDPGKKMSQLPFPNAEIGRAHV